MATDSIISFTSDFGAREYYVGAVKGVMMKITPGAQIVDISHHIASHDILEGAFTILGACPVFPSRTVHLVVVDPGVGSNRRAIIASTANHYYVAPDNGVLSLIYKHLNIARVIAIEADHYFQKPISPTFHARDIFGPVAAYLAQGIDPGKFGPEVTDYVRLQLPPLKKVSDTEIQGIVLHIDKFGNIITNISPGEAEALLGDDRPPQSFATQGKEITKHCTHYSEGDDVEVFSLIGSSGYYELAAHRKPAARLLNVARGAAVTLRVR